MGTMVSRKLREFTDEDVAKGLEGVRRLPRRRARRGKGLLQGRDDRRDRQAGLHPDARRYVGIADTEEDDEPFDEKMARLTSELAKCFEESNRLQEQIKKNLGAIGYGM